MFETARLHTCAVHSVPVSTSINDSGSILQECEGSLPAVRLRRVVRQSRCMRRAGFGSQMLTHQGRGHVSSCRQLCASQLELQLARSWKPARCMRSVTGGLSQRDGLAGHARPLAVVHSQKGQQNGAVSASSGPGSNGVRAQAASGSSQQAAATSSLDVLDYEEVPVSVASAQARRQRLTRLVELRSLYRNFIRAKALLRLPSPVYAASEDQEQDAASTADLDASEVAARERENEREEAERKKEAVEIVAEMQLTADQLKTGLRALSAGFGDIFGSSAQQSEAEEHVRETAKKFIVELRARISKETSQLPFSSPAAAQAALDARNARFSKMYTPPPASGPAEAPLGLVGTPGPAVVSGSPLPASQEAAQQQLLARLGQAEQLAEQFVANRIKPVLRKAREGELVDMVKGSAEYLKGLWQRLNGTGSRMSEPPLSPELPLPVSTKRDTELAISQLSLELDGLEAKLREAARAREAKLRRVRAPETRASMPQQLKVMDEEVLRLSRSLAVLMLQMELAYAYTALEDEALDIASSDVDDVLQRQGSTSELRLLVAEYGYLDEQLSALAALLGAAADVSSSAGAAGSGAAGSSLFHAAAGGAGGAASFHASSSASSNGATLPNVVVVAGVPVSVEELLVALASEIPDMRQRVGVPDQLVFGGQGFSFTKARLQVRDALDKLREAVTFLVRGVRLLGSDVSTAARLFGKAAVGGTLKPREVSALRRTARDILTFIPFTIILIIPLTPLGHVLVFGFIQQYFPSFFPSCFTSKRQELMVRYEELERQLLAARSAAEQAEEEVALYRAAAAKVSIRSKRGFPQNKISEEADASQSGGRNGRKQGGSKTGAGEGEGEGEGEARNGAGKGKQRAYPDLLSLDAATSVALAKQTEQVKVLEERVAAVLDDVTLGGDEQTGASQDAGQEGNTKNGVKKRAARK